MRSFFSIVLAFACSLLAKAYTVGSEDNSDAWNVAFSADYSLTDKQVFSTQFLNYSRKTYNWDNWVLVVKSVGKTQEYFTIRADHYGWGTYYNSGNLSSNYNWSTFKNDMDGSTVDMTVSYADGVVTMNANIKTAAGKSLYETYYASVGTKEGVVVYLTTEGGHLVIDESKTSVNDMEDPAKVVDFGDKTQINSGNLSYSVPAIRRVSVHDPSVVKGYYEGTLYSSSSTVYGEQNADSSRNEVYFIFGSHLAFAYSTDLVNWTYFSNNLNSSSSTIFAEDAAWSAKGDNDYTVSGNMWAPDVIWNPDMKKWCMYMSINGVSWNSTIVLLTAETLNGDWTRVGPVVYSGFTASGSTRDFMATDFTAVTGETSLPARYEQSAYTCNGANASTTWNYRYGAHAIDPCVFYDETGKLWMTYGSWSGGIYIFPLDKSTGLRDMTTQYAYNPSINTDPYMGKKLGGSSSSGEGSYIEYIGGKYYLFQSYGGLTAAGGYNMRVFSSDSPDGTYKDAGNHQALSGGAVGGSIGARIMAYYKWGWFANAQVAQGHNSAIVDDDGRAYLVYHTRFDNGSEGHEVRVHSLWAISEAQGNSSLTNGALLASPFEYKTTDSQKAAYSKEEIVGDYGILLHYMTSYSSLAYNAQKSISLNADGTVSGDFNGTWEQTENSPYLKLSIAAGASTAYVTYEGLLLNQTMEETDIQTLCFTAIGTNASEVALWGFKLPGDAECVSLATKQMPSLAASYADGATLPTTGPYGTTISWFTSSGLVSQAGEVSAADETQDVTLYALVSRGQYCYAKAYSTSIVGSANALEAPTAQGKVAVRTEYYDMRGAYASNQAKALRKGLYISHTVYSDGSTDSSLVPVF